jgi:flagellum-specific peptidoglycan hydrolase FlgJ
VTTLPQIAALAVQIEAETKVPARMLIAQWAVESQWGKTPVGNNNYFGIKYNGIIDKQFTDVKTREVWNYAQIRWWNMQNPGREAQVGQLVTLGKYECFIIDRFADYASPLEACRAYAHLISTGWKYAAAWAVYLRTQDVDALISQVASVYASDPNYANLVKTIAHQANVSEAIHAVASVQS